MYNYDESRIHKFERKYVLQLAKSQLLQEKCRQMWIFGSTVNGVSSHEHTPFSDIDIAVLPKDIKLNEVDGMDLTCSNIIEMHNEILSILMSDVGTGLSRRPHSDIIWMFDNFQSKEIKLYNEIMKGVRII